MDIYKLEESKEEVTMMVDVGPPGKAGMKQGGSSRSERSQEF